MLAKIAYTKSDELMLALLLDVVLLIFVSALIHAVERGARDDQGNLSKFKSSNHVFENLLEFPFSIKCPFQYI